MSMHKSGRNDTITPGASCDLTLADYINRKSKHDALMNSKPKMTFEEWWQRCYEIDSLYKTLLPYKKHFQNCWYTAQQNS